MAKRIRPHHLVIGFGVFWACFSIGSGLGPLVLGWYDDSPIQREVFTNIPGAWKLGFYTVLPVVFVYGSVLFANRVKNWERGAPDRRDTTPKRAKPRFGGSRTGAYTQSPLRAAAAGAMHTTLYFSFLIPFPLTGARHGSEQGPGGPHV